MQNPLADSRQLGVGQVAATRHNVGRSASHARAFSPRLRADLRRMALFQCAEVLNLLNFERAAGQPKCIGLNSETRPDVKTTAVENRSLSVRRT